MVWATIISNFHYKYVSFIIGWISNDELIIFTKTRAVEFIPAFLISISSSYIVIIAFHLHDRIVWIIIIVHVHWTKLESASIQFKREHKVIWALWQINNNAHKSRSTFSLWSSPLNPKEQERNKTIYKGKLPTSKRRTRNLFGFSF